MDQEDEVPAEEKNRKDEVPAGGDEPGRARCQLHAQELVS